MVSTLGKPLSPILQKSSLTDKLALAYLMTEYGATSKIADLSGNNFGAAGLGADGYGLLFGTTWAQGLTGGCLSFDGSTSSVLANTASQTGPLHITSELHLSARIYPTAFNGSGFNRILGNCDTFNSDGFEIFFSQANSGTKVANVTLQTFNGSVAHFITSNDGTVPLKTWSQIDAGMIAGVMYLYINGTKITSFSRSSGSTTATVGLGSANSPSVGALQGTSNNNFLGLIDNTLIWSRGLSAQEVNDINGDAYRIGRPKVWRSFYQSPPSNSGASDGQASGAAGPAYVGESDGTSNTLAGPTYVGSSSGQSSTVAGLAYVGSSSGQSNIIAGLAYVGESDGQSSTVAGILVVGESDGQSSASTGSSGAGESDGQSSTIAGPAYVGESDGQSNIVAGPAYVGESDGQSSALTSPEYIGESDGQSNVANIQGPISVIYCAATASSGPAYVGKSDGQADVEYDNINFGTSDGRSNVANIQGPISIIYCAATVSSGPAYVGKSDGQATVLGGTPSIYNKTLTIGGVSAISSPGGVAYSIAQPIEGYAAISSPGGISYSKTVSVDGNAAADAAFSYFVGVSLSIDGVSDAGVDDQLDALSVIVVAGIADFTINQLLESTDYVTVAGGSDVNVGDIFDVLYVSSFAAVVAAMVVNKIGTEQPHAVGAVSVAVSAHYNRTVTQTLAVTQTVRVAKPTAFVNQTLAINQTVLVIPIHNEVVSQSITFTDLAECTRPASSTLLMSQSATYVLVHNIMIRQTLMLSQSGSRKAVLSRPISQTLAFNVVRQVSGPLIGTIGGGSTTNFAYNVPIAAANLVPRRCIVVLGVPAQSIVLPCPLFGDTQNYTGAMNLKKTMTGDTYTYVKKTATEKLKYSWNLGTYKAIELRDFLVAHCHELITLQNFKGETWYVFLTNNPFEFSHAARWQRSGERVDITLEFEGIRL